MRSRFAFFAFVLTLGWGFAPIAFALDGDPEVWEAQPTRATEIAQFTRLPQHSVLRVDSVEQDVVRRRNWRNYKIYQDGYAIPVLTKRLGLRVVAPNRSFGSGN